jgi:1-acyl-sn-glycerol-3-phosphate acyltransferase
MQGERGVRMSFSYRLVTGLLRGITSLICRIDDAQVEKIPLQGPLIVAVNHVNILDIPVVYTRLMPRPLTAFIKVEAWKNPVERGLLSVWGGIPLHRGQADFVAFRQGLEMLEKNYLLCMAPEGTRNGNGRLLKAQPGVVLLALRSGVPVLPVVYYGHEKVWSRLLRFQRADFHFAVGRPFHIDTHGERVSSQTLRRIINEVMYQMAILLPPQYRGVYTDLSKMSQEYLRFIDE